MTSRWIRPVRLRKQGRTAGTYPGGTFRTRLTPQNLTYASSSSAILRVDTSTEGQDAASGRYSVRVTSKLQYDSGLFILDVKHTPYGCGTWPALWLSE